MLLRVFTGFIVSLVFLTSVQSVGFSTGQSPYLQFFDDARSGRDVPSVKSFVLPADVIGKSPEYVELYINEKNAPQSTPQSQAAGSQGLIGGVIFIGLLAIIVITVITEGDCLPGDCLPGGCPLEGMSLAECIFGCLFTEF